MTESEPCVFCRIIARDAPADVVWEWGDAMAIVPLCPVVDGHTLIIPKVHVADFAEDPAASAATMYRASELACRLTSGASNIITSRGKEATQSVFHLHLHLVPRAAGDHLALPWPRGR
ncbi:HIT family protein [Streptomyces sioyaensis]|uniref:HIT family protein n=1 Tax=Streptomyces sioyaensis TaxID=67364 RepID=UPI003687E5CF